MRTVLVVALIGSGVLLRSEPGSQQADASALVAAAREALGGDAALRAVTSLTLEASLERRLSDITHVDRIEISCILPDKFLQIARKPIGGPINGEIVDYVGFNGTVPIRAMDTLGPMPPPPLPPSTTTPEAARAADLKNGRRTFMLTVLPLFIVAPASYGQTVSAAGKVPLANGQADAIDIASPDLGTRRMLLDENTHLPIKIVWKAKPVVTFSTSTMSSIQMRSGAPGAPPSTPPPPAAFPSGDPTARLAEVDWETTIGEYKLADGMNWPHRLTTTYDGKKWEDTKIGKYKINPKIDPKKFEKKYGG